MASLEEVRATRLEKLERLKKAGIDPYPISCKRDYELKEVIEKFDALAEKGSLSLVGRVMSLRPQGGLVFLNFSDGTGTFQALLRTGDTDEKLLTLFSETVDIGDFLGFEGTLMKTKRGEPSILVSSWTMLAKSLRPLPEKWHGLQDVDERFRHRYLDLLMNEGVRGRFLVRSRIISEVRRFYDSHGYIEVETPMLQPIAGGATARPFVTHHNTLDTDFYLTIAQELYLKQLLVGGVDKVYEIGRKFRNEGIDVTHNPEFTMLESNESYADANSQMEFIETLMRSVAKALTATSEVTYGADIIDFTKPFPRLKFYDLIKEHGGVDDPANASREELEERAKELGITFPPTEGDYKLLDSIYKRTVRPKLIQPTFIVDYPVAFNPFAKRKPEDSKLIDRFQLVAGGIELVNAFSELNNPLDQKERYEEQDRLKKKGEGDISPSDKNYLEAMEYGMPPNGGIGIGIDRLAMLFTDSKNIREVILFPTLRPKE
ncbi:MAG: lysine--tRNA ligase [Candidatus Taylorbacteria bacterium RIFCSPHIGHO2_02_FULL_46_13]|uniref:Lysine--tRNA ligase n=1 Tax=Candidatus Taylorbacteria bacterium RIFCSPHIGHO2_02_FULL_46_13 TaxID=1802312 RepID=A0A1G2MSA2_9BACT|nr:MAG: lysine--tRNA ligase [Candidatus Taylorbacteria bacterium RIFCSPHIGHO2_02_FULL_46_13]